MAYLLGSFASGPFLHVLPSHYFQIYQRCQLFLFSFVVGFVSATAEEVLAREGLLLPFKCQWENNFSPDLN